MAPNPQMFVTGWKTVDIKDFSTLTTGIQSNRFAVGAYAWVIVFYPQGINKSVSDYMSIFVRVLNPADEFHAICTFFLWDWTNSNWQASPPSDLITFSHPAFSASGGKNSWGIDRYKKRITNYVDVSYLKNDTLRIGCSLLVTPREPPAPAPSLKPDSGKGNEYTKLPMQPTVRVYCEAKKDLSVTIRNGTVVLAPSDSNDLYQHWIKDMRYVDKKDVYGFPAFALVNRVTGEALRNPDGENQEVSLVPYNPNHLEDSVKWSTDFRAIRIADMPGLNMTALASAGVEKIYDGAKIIVKGWIDTPVQHWNIVPYNSNVPYKLISNL